MADVDWKGTADTLGVIEHAFEEEAGEWCAALNNAAKLCEREKLLQELLNQLALLRDCPPGEEDWDALCEAEDAVREATP